MVFEAIVLGGLLMLVWIGVGWGAPPTDPPDATPPG